MFSFILFPLPLLLCRYRNQSFENVHLKITFSKFSCQKFQPLKILNTPKFSRSCILWETWDWWWWHSENCELLPYDDPHAKAPNHSRATLLPRALGAFKGHKGCHTLFSWNVELCCRRLLQTLFVCVQFSMFTATGLKELECAKL